MPLAFLALTKKQRGYVCYVMLCYKGVEKEERRKQVLLKHPMSWGEPVIRAEWPHFLCNAQVNRSREKQKGKKRDTMGMIFGILSH